MAPGEQKKQRLEMAIERGLMNGTISKDDILNGEIPSEITTEGLMKLRNIIQSSMSVSEQARLQREQRKSNVEAGETKEETRAAIRKEKQVDLRAQIPFVLANNMRINPKTGKVGNLSPDKIKTINKSTSSTASVVRQAEELENDLKNISPSDLFAGISSDALSFRAGIAQMMIELKSEEQFNLGVIAGPDEGLLKGAFGNIGEQATIIKNWWENLSSSEKEQVGPLYSKALRRLKNNTIKKYNGKLNTFEIKQLTTKQILAFSGQQE